MSKIRIALIFLLWTGIVLQIVVAEISKVDFPTCYNSDKKVLDILSFEFVYPFFISAPITSMVILDTSFLSTGLV